MTRPASLRLGCSFALTGSPGTGLLALLYVITSMLPAFAADLPQLPGMAPLTRGVLPSPGAQLQMESTITVQHFELAGNTVFSAAELAGFTAPYRDRPLRFEDLQALRNRLTRAYVERGYLNSGVLLPRQRMTGGRVTFQAVEGGLDKISVVTHGRVQARYIASRLELAGTPPLKLDRLRDRLRQLQLSPAVESLSADLRPGPALGRAELAVDVRAAKTGTWRFGFDNHGAVGTGDTGLRLGYQDPNLNGIADRLDASLHLTEGLRELGIRYRRPVNAHDTSAGVHLNALEADVIDPDFSDLDIASESFSAGGTVFHPAWSRADDRLELFAGLEHRYSRSTLLGQGFSFAPGPDNGVSRVTVIRAGAEWNGHLAGGAAAARLQLSQGLDVAGATTHADGRPDGRFAAVLGQAQLVRRYPWRSTRLVLRGEFQLSDSPLLGIERFSLGGSSSVRGYRVNELVRDQGVMSSIEARMAAWHTPVAPHHLDIAVFLDGGIGDSHDGPGGRPRHALASAGVGLLGRAANWRYRLMLAHRLRRGLGSERSSLQEQGIHFSLEYQWPD